MAIAAAGGGLLIAAASTVPAYAATPATPAAPAAPAAPRKGHAITVTAHPRAHDGHGIGPHDILPCAVRPGAENPP